MILTLQPKVLQWARNRGGFEDTTALAGKIKISPQAVAAWETTGRLTLGQMQKLANATSTPQGLLFLTEPPQEKLPIPDFRTVGGSQMKNFSTELLDTLHDAQLKQAWYREYTVSMGAEALSFVGSITTKDPIVEAATKIRQAMSLGTDLYAEAANADEALRLQVERIESKGILVLRNGIVGSNTRRKLRVEEFRGFALADPYAPLIFLNNGDSHAAQMFTLAHELIHIWLGKSGISNTEQTYADHSETEKFCNQTAAELLVPASELTVAYQALAHKANPIPSLIKRFKVSSLVILRRLRDIGALDPQTFQRLYQQAEAGFQIKGDSSGGDFYRTELVRVGHRFAVALLESTLEGRTPYREACEMLGINSPATVQNFAKRLELLP